MNDFIKTEGTLTVKGLDLPASSKYPCKVGVVIEWPNSVTYKGKQYYQYNKYATETKSGLPLASYKLAEEYTDARLWLRCDGLITED